MVIKFSFLLVTSDWTVEIFSSVIQQNVVERERARERKKKKLESYETEASGWW